MPTNRSPQFRRVLLQLLRQSRELSGVSQLEMAAALSLRQSDISKIERGVRSVEVIELRLWAQKVGTTFEAFAAVLEEQWEATEHVERYLQMG